jgi:hypothetical protein
VTTKTRILATSSVVLAGGLFLSGCSTAEGLLAPNTQQLYILVSASNNVLLEKGHQIKDAPLCKESTEPTSTYLCSGTTLDDQTISVVVPPATTGTGLEEITAAEDVTIGEMTVSVGSEQIFKGPVQDVVEKFLVQGPTKP